MRFSFCPQQVEKKRINNSRCIPLLWYLFYQGSGVQFFPTLWPVNYLGTSFFQMSICFSFYVFLFFNHSTVSVQELIKIDSLPTRGYHAGVIMFPDLLANIWYELFFDGLIKSHIIFILDSAMLMIWKRLENSVLNERWLFPLFCLLRMNANVEKTESIIWIALWTLCKLIHLTWKHLIWDKYIIVFFFLK